MMTTMDPIELALFSSRIQAVCDEMGAVLRRAAFSPNIKDRLDYSCAVFDAGAELCAQAAHIPVHLGSMAYAMRDIAASCDWQPGDMVIVNDPFLGGTHLPDVTLIAPVFHNGKHIAFVANRAHHADIGADTPGSMPLARRLREEGIILPPQHLLRDGCLDEKTFQSLLDALHNPVQAEADFRAQISANHSGVRRLLTLTDMLGADGFTHALNALNDYSEALATSSLQSLPDGTYRFEDFMDDDGLGHTDIRIQVSLTIRDGHIGVDFNGTADQVEGNINCPLSVTAAAVYYCMHCLMPPQTPACAGSLRPISLSAPPGSLVNARPPAAVAAGNVETSTRLVDTILGALAQADPERIPAASQGSMNNIAMGVVANTGNSTVGWDYYETLAGGMGAGAHGGGLDAVHTHMTNTLNTPVEVVEMNYPLRIRHYGVRHGTGGSGRHRGGDGLVREYEFLAPASVTLLTERRRYMPWGLAGGDNARPGCNLLNDTLIPGKAGIDVKAGDRLRIETPGGGGWGQQSSDKP
jgi:N-methylhydantoinase B